MIRQPLGLRLNSLGARSIKDDIRAAASAGAKGIVLDAAGELGPDRLSETGRREFRHLMRTTELTLVAFHLPTRRPFDSLEGLEDRLARADAAFALAYELNCRLVLVRAGGVPGDADTGRREAWFTAVGELVRRADHRGVRLALELAGDAAPTLRSALDSLNAPSVGGSLDPAGQLAAGEDPISAVRDLGPWLLHAYATDATTGRIAMPAGRRTEFPAGALDWEEYMGSLEEVEYRGFLTVQAPAGVDPFAAFAAVRARVARL